VRKDPLRKALKAIEDVRQHGPSPEALSTLRAVIVQQQGVAVAKAAALAAEWYESALAPDLVAAFDRLTEHGLADDPQCWGKVAILKALNELAWQDEAVYLSGCRVVQLEPVYGGKEDSAASVRIHALNSLMQLPVVSTSTLMAALVDALADQTAKVRTEAVRAAIHAPREIVIPLLRLKVRLGDTETRVLGVCFDTLLFLEPNSETLKLVEDYAASADVRLQAEALASLAGSDFDEAVDFAIRAYQDVTDKQLKRVMLTGFGLSRTPAALDFLYDTLSGSEPEADWALAALKPRMFDETVKQRVQNILSARGK
jgi:hypothetical protein